jgi:hypothetical protein
MLERFVPGACLNTNPIEKFYLSFSIGIRIKRCKHKKDKSNELFLAPLLLVVCSVKPIFQLFF